MRDGLTLRLAPDATARAVGFARKESYTVGLLVIILAIGLAAALASDAFLTTENLTNVLRQISVLAILSAGTTALMVSGGIDLSIGATAALTGVIAAKVITGGGGTAAAIVLALGIGLVIGLANGVATVVSGAPPLILTLGSLSIVSGIALVVSDSRSTPLNGRFEWLGVSSVGGVPVPVAVAVLTLLFIAFLLRFTKLGREAYAIGGNESASYLSGIRIDLDKIVLYALTGVLAALAGLVLLSRVGASSPTSAIGLELQAVAAVVVGGASLAGGRGSVGGTCLGVLLIGLVANVLNLLNVEANYQPIAIGAVIVIAVVLGALGIRRKSARYSV